mgnify:CR=1 FL=1
MNLRVPSPTRFRVPGQRVGLLSLGALALLLGAAGCRTSEPDKVMASVNAFHFYNARYEERCVPQGPVGCASMNAALKKWRGGLDEAGDALKRGGAMPLQVAHVQTLQKEAAKCLPK